MIRHCYLVTYDISDPKRWRKVFRLMHGYGEHVQLSVFRCDLTPPRHARLRLALDPLLHHGEDQVLIARLGRTGDAVLREIEFLGRPHVFRPPGTTIA